MAETLLMCSTSIPFPTPAATTEYLSLVGILTVYVTETDSQQIFHTPGRIEKMLIKIEDNNCDGSTTIRTRVNAANGTLSISAPASTTGDFEDETHMDIVVDGDKVDYQIAVGGSTGEVGTAITRCIFTADQDTVTKNSGLTETAVDNFSTASTTYYNVLSGYNDNLTLTETGTESILKRPGRMENLVVTLAVNSRSTATTLRLRLNGANSSLSVSVGAGLTGFFSDTANVQNVVANDKVNYSLTTGTGAGDFRTNVSQVDFISPNSFGIYIAGSSEGIANPKLTTKYWPVMGNLAFNTPETQIKIRSGVIQADWLELSCNVTQNNVDFPSTINMRNNLTDVNPSLSVPANTTGIFSDASDTITSSYPDDNINLKVTTGDGAGGNTLTVKTTVIHAYIIPFIREEHRSMSSATPEFQQHNLEIQNNFFGNFDSPMYGD